MRAHADGTRLAKGIPSIPEKSEQVDSMSGAASDCNLQHEANYFGIETIAIACELPSEHRSWHVVLSFKNTFFQSDLLRGLPGSSFRAKSGRLVPHVKMLLHCWVEAAVILNAL